jgi:peptidoglycan/LPS O-acetylase OafA/YrhL
MSDQTVLEIFYFKGAVQSMVTKKTITVLDGVRAIACLSVISYHINYFMNQKYGLSRAFGKIGGVLGLAGWSGVTLFFVLSGFLLFMPYAKAMFFEKQWPSIRTFYFRRALRILPGYYVALFLLILLEYPEYLHLDHLKQLLLFLTFLMDAPLTYQHINGPFWTLAVEWQYYMLLPLLALAFAWVVRHGSSPQSRLKLIICCLAVMVLWGLGTRYIGRYYEMHPTETFLVPRSIFDKILLIIYGSSGKYFEDFAIGMLACTLYVYTRSASLEVALSRHINSVSFWLWGTGILLLFFMSIFSIFPALSFLRPYIGVHNWLCEMGYALGYGLCVTSVLFGERGLRMLFDGRIIRGLGQISYSLYIWHIPILLLFKDKIINASHLRFSSAYILYCLCVLLVIIPVCYVFYRVVELPWMRIAQRNRDKEQLVKVA